MAGKEAAAQRQKEQFTEKHAHSLSLETFLKFKGCEWGHLRGGPPLPSLPENAQVSATPEGGSLALPADNVVVLNAVGYKVLVSVRR